MNAAIQEDVIYFAQQSSEQIQWIVSGMTALMQDTEGKAAALQSQNWFQRMVHTITGKNKLSLDEIQQNREKLNSYMAEAVMELYRKNCIDQRVTMSLGMQLNEIYSDQLHLKQMLGAFVGELNQKIESVDNFHMLITEIEQGVYTVGSPTVNICKVLSQLDGRTLMDNRKLDIIQRGLLEKGIINRDSWLLADFCMDVLTIPMSDAGQVYLELGTIHEDFMARLIMKLMESYHFLPDMARKMKNKKSVIDTVLQSEGLDEGTALTVQEIYDSFIASKTEARARLRPISADVSSPAVPAAETTPQAPRPDIAQSGQDAVTDPEELSLDDLQKAAWQGDPESQYQLAERFFYGLDVEEDDTQAVEWYRRAAGQGHAQAQFSLGYCYQNGFGVEENSEQAIKWYYKAAELGSAEAKNRLGVCYHWGLGVPEDLSKAVDFYRQAAEQGLGVATVNIAFCYQNGYGVPEDKTQAFVLYQQALEQGYAPAKIELGHCYMSGTGVQKDLSKAKDLLEEARETDTTGEADYLLAEIIYNTFIQDEPDFDLSALDISNEIPSTSRSTLGSFVTKSAIGLGFAAVKGVSKLKGIPKLLSFLRTADGVQMVNHYKEAAQKGYEPAVEKLKKLKLL